MTVFLMILFLFIAAGWLWILSLVANNKIRLERRHHMIAIITIIILLILNLMQLGWR